MTIQMLVDAGHIPEKSDEGHSFPFVDFASFLEIEDAAENVFHECIVGRRTMGWRSTGMSIVLPHQSRSRKHLLSVARYGLS